MSGAKIKAFKLLKEVREMGINAETDVVGRGLRAQMKYADKIGALYSMVIGDNELAENKATVRNMDTGEQTELALDDSFVGEFSDLLLSNSENIGDIKEIAGALTDFLGQLTAKE